MYNCGVCACDMACRGVQGVRYCIALAVSAAAVLGLGGRLPQATLRVIMVARAAHAASRAPYCYVLLCTVIAVYICYMRLLCMPAIYACGA